MDRKAMGAPGMTPTDPRINPLLVPPGSKAIVIAEHQDEYVDLPSVRTPGEIADGKFVKPPYVITRWTLSLEERAAIVRGEDVFVTLVTAGSINPMFVTVGPVDWSR
jgi:hypothetical protein